MKQYFSRKQDSEINLKKIKAYLRQTFFNFYTGSGVFSKDKVDKGSELLINSVILEDSWRVLDLGCGYGVIGIVVKRLFPKSEVVMVDYNKRALKLSKMNAKLNSVDVNVISSDLYDNVLGKFNTIIVNPPQRAGQDVCFKIISEAKKYLVKGGLLQLVARHNKGGKTLEAKMKEVFGNVEEISKKSGYRVYVSRLM